METITLKVADVVHDRKDIYPRHEIDPSLVGRYAADLDVLPPIEVNQHGHLIDGKHRLLAHQKEGAESIAAFITQTASDTETLELAIRRNSAHGYQLTNEDKQRMARRLYQAKSDKERKGYKDDLARILSVSAKSIQRWVSQIDKDAETERRETAHRLWMSCHTQQEIADAVGVEQRTISNWIEDDFRNLGQLSKISKTAAEFGDADFQPKLYNIWSAGKLSNDVRHPGNSDQMILENLLYAYTEPFDAVIDPFAGGGATIDVCKKRSRRYFVSDLTPIVERAEEIRQHDITAGVLKPPQWRDVSLVYLDPPYWLQAKGMYGDSPSNLANMDADAFHSTLAGVVKEYASHLRQGGRIAMLMQPTQWRAPNRVEVDHIIEIIAAVRALGGKAVYRRRISVPYSTEQANAQMVEWAKENKDWLGLNRELIIWEVA